MDTLAFPLSIKSVDDAGHIVGIAAGIGNVDHGGDRIMPGAFDKTLAALGSNPLPMLLHHRLNRPAGAWTHLAETPEGLSARGKLTLAARDGAEAHALAKDGALRGLSIGYQPVRHAMNGSVRELHEIALHEVSLVTVPMNDRAQISTIKSIGSVAELRDFLQEAGFSGREAKAMAGAAWKARNDAGSEDAAAAELAAIIEASSARIQNLDPNLL